jgi:hypothetical protein
VVELEVGYGTDEDTTEEPKPPEATEDETYPELHGPTVGDETSPLEAPELRGPTVGFVE